MSDELCLGHPSTANTTDITECVNEMIVTNQSIQIRQIPSELNISYGNVFIIIHDHLG